MTNTNIVNTVKNSLRTAFPSSLTTAIDEALAQTVIKGLQSRNMTGHYAENKEEALKKAAEAIFADPSCGNVFRIKGIVKTGETEWSEINATREQMTFQAVPERQEVLIVIGAGLSKERISGILGIE